MLITVQEFRARIYDDLDVMLSELERHSGRGSPNERVAWRNSLPTLAEVLNHDRLRDMHITLVPTPGLILEYRMPGSRATADAVLLGRGANGPSAVIIELKDWHTNGDRHGSREGLVFHNNREVSHPSDQVRGYAEYCRRFHSAVQESKAQVSGCAFFTFASNVEVYRSGPHHHLVDEYPVFGRNRTDMLEGLPKFICERLEAPDADFAKAFDVGSYQQDRGFVAQIAATIRDRRRSPFVLLDGQREGFQKCMREVDRVLGPAQSKAGSTDCERSVIIVDGPPGSGKSAIAAHLWSSIASDPTITENVVLTATSQAQRQNWEALFRNAAAEPGAGGVVRAASQFNPGITVKWVMKQRAAGLPSQVTDWVDINRRFAEQHPVLKCPDRSMAVSIVDEAHALLDPVVTSEAGITPLGWVIHAGPQAYHIIRGSKVSVFLLDSQQSFRENETTTIDSIKQHAKSLGCGAVEIVSLHDTQFRCGGSAEYVQWLELALSDTELEVGEAKTMWRSSMGGPFGFQVHERLSSMDAALRGALQRGHTARILASYARKWVTADAGSPHQLPPESQDFFLPDRRGEPPSWHRVWNYLPDNNYTGFIQAPLESQVAKDPLCEVGCPYVVRGFDFDHVGVVWLSDLVWRDGRWEVNLDQVHESALKKTLARARRGDAVARVRVTQSLKRCYRILLTRAIRGMHVWFEDAETESRVRQLLGESPAAS